MNNLIALLIKNELEPKFFLIKDPNSEKEIDDLLKSNNLQDDMIDDIIFMGQGIPDPIYLKNMINKNGVLGLSNNFQEELMTYKVRKNRSMLLEQTDKDYFQAFSRDDKMALKKINENKQFLRDLTKKPLIKNSEIINLFFNISDLIIEDPGSGYDSPPKITIEHPNSKNAPAMLSMQIGSAGERAEATCSIKNGSINSITMKNWGSGYVSTPSITVESPTSKDSKVAKLSPLIINVLMLKEQT